MGPVIPAEIIHDFVRFSRFYEISTPAEFIYDDVFEFLINQGAEIECRARFRKETALLVTAEVDNMLSLTMMSVLLRFDADYSAVDYKGRGPLHLALKPSRYYHGNKSLHSRTFKEKLVYLLQAGCSIHAIDNYARTPTYVAQKWGRSKVWEAALQEVGKLGCGRSECQCEITVRYPRLSAFPSRGLR